MEIHRYLFQYIFLDFSHVSIFSFTIPPFKCSVISLLVFECYGGEDYLHNLHQVGVFIRTFQARHKMKHNTDVAWINSPCFSLGKNSPNWEERLLKFTAWLWTLWKNKMNTENDHHRLIDFFLKFNVEVDTILNDFHPRHGFLAVPLQEATQLYSRGMQMAQIHCQLMTF